MLAADAPMRVPGPDHRDLGVIDALDAHVDILPGVRRVRMADHLVLASLVGELVADLEPHREDTEPDRLLGLWMLLGPRLSHPCYAPRAVTMALRVGVPAPRPR
jgi:hypothetical protein